MELNGSTRLGGLIGSPVAHSISPMMHNTAFRALDLNMVYLCFEVSPDRLPAAVAALRELNVYGFNVTMPHKETILPFLDDLSPAAKLIGAVNTVSNENGVLTGHNTDGIGFMKSLSMAGIDVKGKEMTLMGAGGAAAAIAVQAALDGVSVLHLACRRSSSWSKAEALADKINRETSCRADLTDLADLSQMQHILSESVLLANATSAGMGQHTEETALPSLSLLKEDLAVSDIIYHPAETRLLREARAIGCRTTDGLAMLLCQGEAAFRIWTGADMPFDLVREKCFPDL